MELAERVEDRKVGAQAVKDLVVFDRLLPGFHAELVIAFHSQGPTKELAKVAQELAALVSRYVKAVDATNLKDAPQCVSCARSGKVRGVTYSGWKGIEVYAKAKKHSLCQWCYSHATDDAKAKGRRGLGQLPPVDIIDILHMEGPRKAGIALARQTQRRGAA